MTISIRDDGAVRVVTIERPAVRNAVDGPTARLLYDAFVDFDPDDAVAVAVLTGAAARSAPAPISARSSTAGAITSAPTPPTRSSVRSGPMGPTRLLLDKPVIAAVEGFAVAGGLELACWADLRVAAADATFGVYCRRWGVPLIDGGTIRLPRLIGQSRALDLILTGSRHRRCRGRAHRAGQPRRADRRGARRGDRVGRRDRRAAADLPAVRPRDRPTTSGRCRSARRSSHEVALGLATIAVRRDRRGCPPLRLRRRPPRPTRLTAHERRPIRPR